MSQPFYTYDSKVSGGFTTTPNYLSFGFYAHSMIIVAPYNTNTDDIYYSFDNMTWTRLQVSSYAANLQNLVKNGIYIKSNSGTQGALVIAY